MASVAPPVNMISSGLSAWMNLASCARTAYEPKRKFLLDRQNYLTVPFAVLHPVFPRTRKNLGQLGGHSLVHLEWLTRAIMPKKGFLDRCTLIETHPQMNELTTASVEGAGVGPPCVVQKRRTRKP